MVVAAGWTPGLFYDHPEALEAPKDLVCRVQRIGINENELLGATKAAVSARNRPPPKT
jgi:hypothetical protein